MNSCQKYFSACVLALLAQAAFAQAPELGTAANFAVLSAAPLGGGAVTCTNSTIDGNVGSSGGAASVTLTGCPITGAVVAPVPEQVVTDFNSAYSDLANTQCDVTILDAAFTNNVPALGPLAPGVYCFPAAVTFTDTTLTLTGDGIWIFKVGTEAPGALTGTSFDVVMADASADACNVYWWVDAAATTTTSQFKGTILAGAGITLGGAIEGDALAKAGVTLTDVTSVGCEAGTVKPPLKKHCNQGVGNGPEFCDPGNSNQGNPFRSNDELGGTPGKPGKKGGNK